MPTHVAFVGDYGVGKTTAAQALCELNDVGGYVRLSFAAPVKQDCARMLDKMVSEAMNIRSLSSDMKHYMISVKTIEEHKKAVFGPLLQWYGTNFWREFMGVPNFWIDRFKQTFYGMDPTAPIVVDDCRFINEAEALKELGFIIVRLVRSDATQGDDARSRSHASETEQRLILEDVTLDLTGTTIEQAKEIVPIVLTPDQWKDSPYVISVTPQDQFTVR